MPGVTCRHPAADQIATAAFSAAWADGSFCHQEKAILEVILENLGLESAERQARIEACTSPPPLAPPPEDFSVRLLMMRYAMAVSLADGAIESGEAEFLVELAQHLGISARAFGILKLEVQKMVGSLASVDLLQRVEALLPQR